MDPKIQQVKSAVETLLEKMGVLGNVELIEGADEIQFNVKTREAGMLIGNGGKNLAALNHLVKKIALKQMGGDGEEKSGPVVSLDVNDYNKQKIESLQEMARMNAQRVRYFKKEIALPPMSAYDRRVVHSVLTEYPDIITESKGEEPNRCVVVKPYLI